TSLPAGPPDRRRRRRALGWSAGALGSVALGAALAHASVSVAHQRLPVTAMVPAYVSSSNREWSVLAGAPEGVGAVIVNPDSGPGLRPNGRLARRAAHLRARGIMTLGYVGTDFGGRPIPDVLRAMHRYRVWYGVNGYFLDEGALEASDLPYYRQLRQA